jgi:mono/diheme cytochrome c family protein
MKLLNAMLLLLFVVAIGGGLYVWSGLYDIGADAPHTRPVYLVLEALRERSIGKHAETVKVPPLDDPGLIADGAAHYAEMCTGCHLAPGMSESEIRPGLYPQPPELARQHGENPAEQFWVIKHGIKLSAMPAWGATHDDQAIWSMVAFLQKLPALTPEQYARMTAHADEDHAHHHDEEHQP